MRCAACGETYEGSSHEAMDRHFEACEAVRPCGEPWNPEEEHGWDYHDLMAL